MSAKRASVIVVAYRRDADLPLCLDALLHQTVQRSDYEIIVVDNGGNPNAKISHQALVDQWLTTDSNLGCSGGRNFGANAASTEVLAFVDDDGLVESKFLEIALRVLHSSPAVVGVRGRVIARNHPILTMLPGVYDLGPAPYDRAVLDCEGCSAVKRRPFVDTGGFACELAGGEGLDWTVRVMTTYPGARIAYEPTLVMRHDYVDSLRRFLSKAHMNRRGMERMENEIERFPNLRPPSGMFCYDAMPDRRSHTVRIVSRIGAIAIKIAEYFPEIKSDIRK